MSPNTATMSPGALCPFENHWYKGYNPLRYHSVGVHILFTLRTTSLLGDPRLQWLLYWALLLGHCVNLHSGPVSHSITTYPGFACVQSTRVECLRCAGHHASYRGYSQQTEFRLCSHLPADGGWQAAGHDDSHACWRLTTPHGNPYPCLFALPSPNPWVLAIPWTPQSLCICCSLCWERPSSLRPYSSPLTFFRRCSLKW